MSVFIAIHVFFGVNLGLGLTSYTGNRGLAYRDNHPSFHFSLLYFIDFQNAFTMGIEYSKHSMVIDTKVLSSPSENPGLIEVSMLRPFFGFRYYIDTTDLGTAITYSNPYYVGRVEYWYQTNEFPESNNLENESDGGIGFGFGMGLEFPIEIRKKYLNIEFLYHWVNFFDKDTRDYQQLTAEDQAERGVTSEFGYDDLSGDVLSVMVNYHISW